MAPRAPRPPSSRVAGRTVTLGPAGPAGPARFRKAGTAGSNGPTGPLASQVSHAPLAPSAQVAPQVSQPRRFQNQQAPQPQQALHAPLDPKGPTCPAMLHCGARGPQRASERLGRVALRSRGAEQTPTIRHGQRLQTRARRSMWPAARVAKD
eukprot:8289001-Pyramimonas_sp.AAC.1